MGGYVNPSTGNVFDIGNIIQEEIIYDFIGLGNPALFHNVMYWGSYHIKSFKNANLLLSLQDFGTLEAIKFHGSAYNINGETLNDLFTQLPPTTKTATISITVVSGRFECDPTIATAKGYTVVI